MPALNIDPDFFDHPKTRRLCRKLGPCAEVHVLRLWSHAAKYYPEDGAFADYPADEIEEIACWRGESGQLVEVLVMLRFLDRTETGFRVHSWEEHQGHIAAYKARGKAMAAARWSRSVDATSNAVGNATSIATRNAASNACSIATGNATGNAITKLTKLTNKTSKTSRTSGSSRTNRTIKAKALNFELLKGGHVSDPSAAEGSKLKAKVPQVSPEKQRENAMIAECLAVLGKEAMANYGGSWRNRIRRDPDKVRRVLAECNNAKKENRPVDCMEAFANDLSERWQ